MDKIISLVSVSGSVLIGFAGVVAPLIFNHIKDVRDYKRKQLEIFEEHRLSAHRDFIDAYCGYINRLRISGSIQETNSDEVFRTGSAVYLVSDTKTKKFISTMLRAIDVSRAPSIADEFEWPNDAFWNYLEHVSSDYNLTINQLLGKKSDVKLKQDSLNSK